jgi:hypothetical protein
VECEMRQLSTFIFTGLVAIAVPLCAQPYPQQARFVGSSAADQGRCTVDLVIDGSAEVELQGAGAYLRLLSGPQPQWRRFDCTGVMPEDPMDFQFRALSGRGAQKLIHDPRNGGPAVVLIKDPKKGSGRYSFDITWSAGTPFSSSAVRACENTVKLEAYQLFYGRDVAVHITKSVNRPGPKDLIYGTVDIRGPYTPDMRYAFSCVVNYGSGRVLQAGIAGYPLAPPGWFDRHYGWGASMSYGSHY